MLGTVSLMGLSLGADGPAADVLRASACGRRCCSILLRILQGFALGGESTGAQLMAIEHASPDRRGKYSGLLGLCSPLSQIMANGALLLLASVMSAEAFDSVWLAHSVPAQLRADRGRRVYPG